MHGAQSYVRITNLLQNSYFRAKLFKLFKSDRLQFFWKNNTKTSTCHNKSKMIKSKMINDERTVILLSLEAFLSILCNSWNYLHKCILQAKKGILAHERLNIFLNSNP